MPDGAIGLAISNDGGATFQAYNGGIPVVPNGSGFCDPDSQYAVQPSVLLHNGLYYMVYEGESQSLGEPIGCGNRGAIVLATSTDGIAWAKHGVILSRDPNPLSWEDNNIGGPFIGWFNNQFYVFYHGNSGLIYTASDRSRIGVAYGSDLYSLTKFGNNPVLDVGAAAYTWDSAVAARPSVMEEGGFYYMSYEGSRNAYCSSPPGINGDWGWGMAQSTDLLHWTKYPYNPIRQTYNDINCLNNNPNLFRYKGSTWVYQYDSGQRNLLTVGTTYSTTSGGVTVVHPGGDPYLYVYQALSQCSKYHDLGFADGDGWGANTTTQPSSGYMCYGPYETALPVGKYSVTWQVWIDSDTGVNDQALTVDINNTSGSVASQVINRWDFGSSQAYQGMVLQFQSMPGQSYQWLAWWINHSYIHLHFVAVRQLDG